MLSRQTSHARTMRSTFEERVLAQLGGTKKLKIQGAYLEPVTRRNSVNLTWTVLEESLHKYYADSKKPDETDAVLKYIREKRETKSTTYLKKTPIVETLTEK
jgi:hypothetical protein